MINDLVRRIKVRLDSLRIRTRKLEEFNIDLPNHINTNIEAKVLSNGKELNAYSQQDHTNKVYIRNKNCWCYDIDLTCVSPWNSYSNNLRGGTLITPNHVIFSTHFPIPKNTNIRFVSNHNEVVDVNIIETQSIPYSDFTIGFLQYRVPECIKPCKILPFDWARYIPFDKYYWEKTKLKYRLSTIYFDQEEKCLSSDIHSINLDRKVIQCTRPSNPILQPLFENLITFDSGNPCFISIFNEPILLTTWTVGGGGSGSFISSYIDQINKILFGMRDVESPPEKLDEIDLYKFRLI